MTAPRTALGKYVSSLRRWAADSTKENATLVTLAGAAMVGGWPSTKARVLAGRELRAIARTLFEAAGYLDPPLAPGADVQPADPADGKAGAR